MELIKGVLCSSGCRVILCRRICGGINKKSLERVYGIKGELFSKGVKVKKGG